MGLSDLKVWDLSVLLLILLSYCLASWLYKLSKGNALANPLLVTSLITAFLLFLLNIDFQQHRRGAEVLTWLLGPATILLAVPVYLQFSMARNQWSLVCLPVIAGGVAAPVSAYWLVYYLELDIAVQLAVFTKSITTPLAMETAGAIGAYQQLAAIFVCVTGIMGAVIANFLFNKARITSEEAQGLALGTSAHAIGTAKALLISEKTGAYSSMALCINGILTAIVLPLLIWWFKG